MLIIVFLEIVSYILQYGNYDLGIGIMLNLKLPIQAILSSVASKLIKEEKLREVKALIRRGMVI
jgi:hypothetical protein